MDVWWVWSRGIAVCYKQIQSDAILKMWYALLDRIKILHKSNSADASKEGNFDAAKRKLSKHLEKFEAESQKYLIFAPDEESSDDEDGEDVGCQDDQETQQSAPNTDGMPMKMSKKELKNEVWI